MASLVGKGLIQWESARYMNYPCDSVLHYSHTTLTTWVGSIKVTRRWDFGYQELLQLTDIPSPPFFSVIDSLESTCRDRADTQYIMLIQKIVRNLIAFMTTYYSSFSVFLAKKTPSEVKHHCESIAPESFQTAKIGFLLLSSDGLVQIWLTPSRRCLHKTAALNTEQCTTPSLFKVS